MGPPERHGLVPLKVRACLDFAAPRLKALLAENARPPAVPAGR